MRCIVQGKGAVQLGKLLMSTWCPLWRRRNMNSQANAGFVLKMTCFGNKSNIRSILMLMSGVVASARNHFEQKNLSISILQTGTIICWIILKEDAWQIFVEHFTVIWQWSSRNQKVNAMLLQLQGTVIFVRTLRTVAFLLIKGILPADFMNFSCANSVMLILAMGAPNLSPKVAGNKQTDSTWLSASWQCCFCLCSIS